MGKIFFLLMLLAAFLMNPQNASAESHAQAPTTARSSRPNADSQSWFERYNDCRKGLWRQTGGNRIAAELGQFGYPNLDQMPQFLTADGKKELKETRQSLLGNSDAGKGKPPVVLWYGNVFDGEYLHTNLSMLIFTQDGKELLQVPFPPKPSYSYIDQRRYVDRSEKRNRYTYFLKVVDPQGKIAPFYPEVDVETGNGGLPLKNIEIKAFPFGQGRISSDSYTTVEIKRPDLNQQEMRGTLIDGLYKTIADHSKRAIWEIQEGTHYYSSWEKPLLACAELMKNDPSDELLLRLLLDEIKKVREAKQTKDSAPKSKP